MTIAQIYQNYRIVPNLALHMYRVAALVNVNHRWDDIIRRYRHRRHPLANINFIETCRRYTLELETQSLKKLWPLISKPSPIIPSPIYHKLHETTDAGY